MKTSLTLVLVVVSFFGCAVGVKPQTVVAKPVASEPRGSDKFDVVAEESETAVAEFDLSGLRPAMRPFATKQVGYGRIVIAVNDRGCDVQMKTGEDEFVVNGVEQELFGYDRLEFEASGRDGYRTFTTRTAQVTPDGVLQIITNTPAGEQLVYNARQQAPEGFRFQGQPTGINLHSGHFYGVAVQISNGKESRMFVQCVSAPSF